MIRITSKLDGFRRAGLAHPASPTDYPNDAFSDAQLAQLQAEPMLVVELLPAAGSGDGDNKPATKDAAQTTAAAKPAKGAGKGADNGKAAD